MRHVIKALGVGVRFLERPELNSQSTRSGFQEVRQIQMIGAEADAVFAQRRARGLFEALDLLGDAMTLQHPELFGELERDASRNAGDVLGRREREQRAEQFFQMRLEPEIEPCL